MNIISRIKNNILFLILSLFLNIMLILLGRFIDDFSLIPNLNGSFFIILSLYVFLDFLALGATLYHLENIKEKENFLGRVRYVPRKSKDYLARLFLFLILLVFLLVIKFFIDFFIYRVLFESVFSNILIVVATITLLIFSLLKSKRIRKKTPSIPITSFNPSSSHWKLFLLLSLGVYLYSLFLPINLWFTIVSSIIIGIFLVLILIYWAYQFIMNPTKIFNMLKMLGVSIFILLVFLFFSLPNVRQIEKVTNHSSILVTIKDNKISNPRPINSIPIKYNRLPKKLIQAVITQEDRGFYTHLGFSIKGTIKGILNLLLGKSGGGSGITQQLAKNLFFYIGSAPKKITIQRKIYEILLALKIEMNFSKDEILTMYFNAISFGGKYNGIESASRGYFNKYTSELNTYESVLLVQSIPLPAKFNVKRDKEKAFKRANKLLIKMKEEGYITQLEINKVRKISIKKGTRILRKRTHRFLFDYVKKDILKICKGKNGSFTIVLTLEPEKQLYAQLALERRMKAIKGKSPQSALLSLSPTGAIIAMVGSTDYSKSQFNRTVGANRQPASTFKPIIYLAALENGWKPNSKISDAKIKIGNFSPKNYDGKYLGDISLTYALKKSRNTSSVRLIKKLNYSDIDSLAKRLGISEKLPHKAMLVLGYKEISMLEMTAAYTVFSNGGKKVKPYGIELIRDRLGDVIYEHIEEKQEQVVKLEHISNINQMLKEVIKSGTGKKAGGFIAEIAGKTGTGQKNKDAWFIGYSSYLTTAVWIGHDDNKPMNNVTGGGHPAIAWRSFMTNSHQGLERKNLP